MSISRPAFNKESFEASGISVGGDPPFALTSKLFLDSEPEANPATAVRRLALDRF